MNNLASVTRNGVDCQTPGWLADRKPHFGGYTSVALVLISGCLLFAAERPPAGDVDDGVVCVWTRRASTWYWIGVIDCLATLSVIVYANMYRRILTQKKKRKEKKRKNTTRVTHTEAGVVY